VPEPSNAETAAALVDVLAELFTRVRDHVEKVVQPYDLAVPSAKALRLIDGSMSMKELGSRIHCDGSFVTAIADALEQRGLAGREIDRGDRRIKNLVLTPEGVALRTRLIDELFGDFPGIDSLDAPERRTLLALLRKMVASDGAPGPEGGCAA